MFTSRAEFRLTLRADNADLRLTEAGRQWGCVGSRRAAAFADRQQALAAARALAERLRATPQDLARHGLAVSQDGVRRRAFDLLSYPGVDGERLAVIWPELATVSPTVMAQLEADAKYSVYLDRQTADIARTRADAAFVLASDLNYAALPGLSRELSEKLSRLRPATLAEAQMIEGMTPAALTILTSRAAMRSGAKAA
jgi:tRNA uridine 5-carboxymethylaminomethyl modification enzyme